MIFCSFSVRSRDGASPGAKPSNGRKMEGTSENGGCLFMSGAFQPIKIDKTTMERSENLSREKQMNRGGGGLVV